MATNTDQKSYLQKYLSGKSSDKKKKKRKTIKGAGFKIIDDDIDLSKLRALDGDELDILDEGEDAPQIVGIIDERPEEIKKLEQFKTSSKWRVVSQDDGFNSKLQIEEIKKDIKEKEKENELIFGKMYSDSEDEKKNDSDLSPPRKQNSNPKTYKTSRELQSHSDSDFSPPRKASRVSPDIKHKTSNKNYDSNQSPPRKQEQKTKERVRKPSRWGDFDQNETKRRHVSPDSTVSPLRKSKKHKGSSPRISKEVLPKKRYMSPGSDVSPSRKSHKGRSYESNLPLNKKSGNYSPKKRTRSPDSDYSPPRKREKSQEKQQKSKYRLDNKHCRNYEKSQKSRKSYDSDQSPPRKKRQKSLSPKVSKKSTERNHSKRKNDSDSDLSPPRKMQRESPRREKDYNRSYKRSSGSPPPSNKKMAKTLEGRKAGLQDAKQLREENNAFRRREEEAFSKMTDDVSGKNARVISRKSKRETSEERQKQIEKEGRQRELDEKYKRWGRGLKQLEAQEARVQEYLHEAAKPLARHKGDKDLENQLKDVERAGDPMLQYIRDKKRERGELKPEKPTYKGNFPPNRFNIRPGYRWDGVDRSNGYEKKYFEQQSKRKAQEEEAYKWSTEDL